MKITFPQRWQKNSVLRWVTVGLVSLTMIACFVVLDGPFFTLDYAMTLGEDWKRASLPGDLSHVGMTDPTPAQLDVSKPKPAIEQSSPASKWTFHATWVANQGYHWVLKDRAGVEY
jgi:hypothetical protein